MFHGACSFVGLTDVGSNSSGGGGGMSLLKVAAGCSSTAVGTVMLGNGRRIAAVSSSVTGAALTVICTHINKVAVNTGIRTLNISLLILLIHLTVGGGIMGVKLRFIAKPTRRVKIT